jgi:threonine dehydrogenase-like Zn-dependent dehydrogenase
MASMRAAVVERPRTATVQATPRPEPRSGEVRVRLLGCGVCGSNLPVWQGQPWFTYPLAAGAPGHEGWGVVDAIGDGVTHARPGDAVAVLSTRAFAEYDLAPASAVARLPEALAGQPYPGEAIGCAMAVFRRAAVASGQAVAIVGVGFLGAMVTRLCANAGARVVAISRRPFARDVACEQGAEAAVAMTTPAETVAKVLAWSGGASFPVVIEAAGTQPSLDVAAALVDVGGRLVIAGYHQDGPRQVDMQSWNWRGLDVINAHERDERVVMDAVRAGADAVAAGALDPAPLFTHRVRLDQLERGLDLLAERPDGFLKALVLP